MLENWSSLSRAERDAAYNSNGAVADSPALIERRNSLSTAFRAAHAGSLDVPYGKEPRQKWDRYPALQPDAPCLVFIQGGY